MEAPDLWVFAPRFTFNYFISLNIPQGMPCRYKPLQTVTNCSKPQQNATWEYYYFTTISI
jgi:hypothetical protein